MTMLYSQWIFQRLFNGVTVDSKDKAICLNIDKNNKYTIYSICNMTNIFYKT